MNFELRDENIPRWADLYDVGSDSEIADLVPVVRRAGCLTKADILKVVDWKSPRPRRFVENAPDALICEATAIALRTGSEKPCEELRIGVLTLIPGIGFPTASAILHWFHEDPYPVLDFRALWSLGVKPPSGYRFEFWMQYVDACREFAVAYFAVADKVTMRLLDRALWQYSKEHQRSVADRPEINLAHRP